MAEETPPAMPVPTEVIPSVPGKLSGIASASAPFIFFDGVPYGHINEGIAMLTLTAGRFVATMPDDTVPPDFVAVAHLRSSVPALLKLKTMIDNLLLNASTPSTNPN